MYPKVVSVMANAMMRKSSLIVCRIMKPIISPIMNGIAIGTIHANSVGITLFISFYFIFFKLATILLGDIS
jgi:hypothetical protein